MVAALERGGARVLDLGCGEGAAARLIAAAYPAARITGVDIDAVRSQSTLLLLVACDVSSTLRDCL